MKEIAPINEWAVFAQALGDAVGYPKSDEDQSRVGYSSEELKRLHGALLEFHDMDLSVLDKKMILNSIDGALDYVDIDIPSLYDMSENELRVFKECLEARWNVRSTYRRV